MGYNCETYDYDCYNPEGVDYKYIENEICDNWWLFLTSAIGQSVALFGGYLEDSLKGTFFGCKAALKERL